MNRATGGHDGPEDVDATFAEIVADLRAEGLGRDTAPAGRDATPPEPPREPAGSQQPGWRDGGTEWETVVFGDDPAGDDEHYVPPEPPPLPRPRKGAVVVLLLFVLALLLLIAPGVVGLSSAVGTPLGILGLAAAIALLLLRVRQGPPDGADPSTGAQV
ncbi:hypothetical protein SAMN05421810_104395 [Amycolatopsis arida]|uniref:DUF308 domain-containing protein n=1 Tax=Amycolatopsis arida TaxID=587909 RepID=A0A1I5VIV7_9PSEU|nr:hypothetical protein [Amycolatopsis arida]TDX87908.1 hypothetical protein CLV69_11241 [Amycolatopsis arida]SFQ07498.1 hypothetical protein SAMN05421810_104395 [Amycolatopsis arida]